MAKIEIENCLSDDRRNGAKSFVNQVRAYHYRKMIDGLKTDIANLEKRIAEYDRKKAELLKAKEIISK